MSEFFLNILNMSISASWIVLAVLLLRVLLKKAPKWINVVLWGIVAVRLICPFSIESALSLMPSSQTINPEVVLNTPAIDSGVPIIDDVIHPIIGEATITFQTEESLNFFPIHYAVFGRTMAHGHYRTFNIQCIEFCAIKEKSQHRGFTPRQYISKRKYFFTVCFGCYEAQNIYPLFLKRSRPRKRHRTRTSAYPTKRPLVEAFRFSCTHTTLV